MDEILKTLVDQVEGATGAAVGGVDGLLIEQYGAGVDLGDAVAEHANLLRNTRAAYTETLQTGDLREMMVVTEKMIGYTQPIGEEYFVLLLLEPIANLGKARLRSQDAARGLREMIGA